MLLQPMSFPGMHMPLQRAAHTSSSSVSEMESSKLTEQLGLLERGSECFRQRVNRDAAAMYSVRKRMF